MGSPRQSSPDSSGQGIEPNGVKRAQRGHPFPKVAEFRALLGIPGLIPLLIWSFPARLHLSAAVVALLLLVAEEMDSPAQAGLVTGFFVFGQGASGPIRGRLVDERRAAGPLVGFSLVYALGLSVLAWLPLNSTAALASVALVVGFLCPPCTQVVRAKIAQLVERSHQAQAFSLQSVLNELVLVCGPGLVSGVVAVQSARFALFVCAVIAGGGGLGLARACITADVNDPAHSPHSAVKNRRLSIPAQTWMLIGTIALLVGGLSAIDLTLVLWSLSSGRPELGGILIAVWAVGSIGGGLAGASLHRYVPLTGGVMAVLVTAIPLVVAALVSSSIPVVVVSLILLVNGWCIPPVMAQLYAKVSDSAPGSSGTAFGWQAAACTVTGALAHSMGGMAFEIGGAAASIAIATVGSLAAVAVTFFASRGEPLSASK